MSKIRIRKEVLTQWLADLRSGEYPQGTGVLWRLGGGELRPAGFCCLGVLTDQGTKAGIGHWKSEGDSASWVLTPDQSLGADSYPSYEIVEWAGIQVGTDDAPKNPRIYVDDEMREVALSKNHDLGPLVTTTLADLNDEWDFTFEEIADVIERHFEGY